MEFKPKKSLGQNFLNNPHVPRRMCEAGEVKAEDVILEIGPGTGALTKELLALGAKVVAVETDVRAIEILREKFSDEIKSGQLQIFSTDDKKIDFSTLPLKEHEYKVVANIPYYLSGLLFRQLLSGECQPSLLVFLIQKEVAARIARDQKSSLLSLSVAVFGDPTYICTVKRGNFTPAPKIDSAIIRVANISRDKLDGLEAGEFFELLHLGFGQKRKQLRANVGAAFGRPHVEASLTALNLPLTVRAEDIDLETWLKLAKLLLKQ